MTQSKQDENKEVVPFFARYLEGQIQQQKAVNVETRKYPSDEEDEASVTEKYPSDEEDEASVTEKFPSDEEDEGGEEIGTLKFPSDEEDEGAVETRKYPSDEEDG